MIFIRQSADAARRARERPARPRQGRSRARPSSGRPSSRSADLVRRAPRHAAAAAGERRRGRSCSTSPTNPPISHTDEAKVSQILRNFISNALKFTDARRGPGLGDASRRRRRRHRLLASPTPGIGIAPRTDQERIFQEFAQVESPVQRRVKGTGLGLPLCRRARASSSAAAVAVESAGRRRLDVHRDDPGDLCSARADAGATWELEPLRMPVLRRRGQRRDDPALREAAWPAAAFRSCRACSRARGAREAARASGRARSCSTSLLRGEDSVGLPHGAEAPATTRTDVPVAGRHYRRRRAQGARARRRRVLREARRSPSSRPLLDPRSLRRRRSRRILIVDDEEVSRYVLRQHLMTPAATIWEVANGDDALRLAREQPPDVVCLDLAMPDADGHSRSCGVSRTIPETLRHPGRHRHGAAGRRSAAARLSPSRPARHQQARDLARERARDDRGRRSGPVGSAWP